MLQANLVEKDDHMDSDRLNQAIIVGISGSPIPSVDRAKLVDRFGATDGNHVYEQVIELVREAVSMPVDWGEMTLAEGVNDVMTRFGQRHPNLTGAALHEIGRCVGWQLR